MLTVDDVAGGAAVWATAVVAGYLVVGFATAVIAEQRATAGRCAERLLLLYPRVVRTALQTLAVAAVGLGTAAPTAALADPPAHAGKPRPPVVAPARTAAEPLDWPVAGDPGVVDAPVPHLVHRPLTPAAPNRVAVRSGDCLWTIAARALGPSATARQVAAAWPHWWSANRDLIGDDPDLLRPGLQLRVPPITERSAS